MKSYLGIIMISLLFYMNPISVKNSNAGLFSSPLEKCMDRAIKHTFNGDEQYAATAAKFCKGADSSTDKCIDRLIKGTFNNNKRYALTAAKLCLGN